MSREKILQSIKKANLTKVELPQIPEFRTDEPNLESIFAKNIETVGGKFYRCTKESIIEHILKFRENGRIFSNVSYIPSDFKSIDQLSDRQDLKDIHLAIFECNWAIGENGAIWIDENQLTHRAIPFITQHLAFIVQREKLLPNMHEVYKRIDLTTSGYGTFISGPSKTADIEQALVIGAHGPRSLTIFFLD